MFFLSTIDYKKYKMFDKIGYAVTVLLLLAVLIPGVGLESGGAIRWIVIGRFNFQPSEIAKIALVIFFASYLTDNREKLEERWEGFLRPLVLYLLPIIAILFFVQSHLSASVLIIAVISIMMIMSGCKLRYFFTYGSVGVAGAVGIMYFMATVLGKGGFRLGRIASFLDPWADASGKGYQVVQGLYAIGSRADFLENGLGNSTQKYLYIPEPQNDFIFSIIAEELGFIGCVVVIVLFAVFVWRGIVIAMKAPDMFGSLVAVGITAIIGLQAMINIGVVTASIPNTGMQLPFFSYGGTSLLILLCAVRSTAEYFKTRQRIMKIL